MPNDRFPEVKSVLDSGATDSCAPDCMCPEVKSRPSEGSRRGQMYTTAGGKNIANQGEKDITMVTGANEVVQTNWQTVDVTRPLSSVRQMCLQGNRVIFGAQDGVIYNIESGHEPPFWCREQCLRLRLVATTEPYAGFWTAGMSHSSVDDSLVKNLVSPFYLPTLGGFEEEEDRQEGDWQDEPEDEDEEEVEDSREDGLFGQEEEIEEVEEAREGKTRALPKGPSEEQMRVHRRTHYPLRSWCAQCVAGRAKSWPHFRQEVSDDGGVPTICFDYCFWRDHPGGESVPVLVGRGRKPKMMIAHVVPFKGGGVDWLVGQLVRDLRKMGVHGKVVLESDQENPIVDVLNDVGDGNKTMSAPEELPP